MKQKKTLTDWFTTRLLVIIRDEENLAQKGKFTINYVRVFLIIFSSFLLLSVLSFLLMTTLLAQWFDPRVEYVQTTRKLIELEMQVDSLEIASEQKDRYMQNIFNIINGKIDYGNTESPSTGISPGKNIDLMRVDSVDQEFRKEFEDVDYEKLTLMSDRREDLQGMFLFPPIMGLVTREFDLKISHYGTDIVARKDEPVKAVADGTVIMASWTRDAGYVLGIQHKNQLISFYKHNAVLLKEVGDPVSTAEIVAIIGNSGEITDGPHLHFELWYQGNPINPAYFISFE